MSDKMNAELVGLIEKQLFQLGRIHSSIADAIGRDVPLLGRTGNAAVLVAGLIDNYYTCLETAFQKISQRFENHLEPARWHADLLVKMTLKIEGVRIPAPSRYPATFTPISLPIPKVTAAARSPMSTCRRP